MKTFCLEVNQKKRKIRVEKIHHTNYEVKKDFFSKNYVRHLIIKYSLK